MVQRHLDRLSSVDAGFLHAEDGSDAHMHIGGLAILDGPPPRIEEFTDHIASRLHLVPRYRQRVVNPPLQSGRPVWVDDRDFTISYHVRHTALPRPGSEEQLRRLVARIASQRLDRTKPLWEVWLIEGLEDDRFAVINKTHHALVDGVGGVDILTALFDLSPESRPVEDDDWQPQTTPGGVGLVAHSAQGAARRVAGLATGAIGALLSPRSTVDRATTAAQGVWEIAERLIDPAPATPLNAKPGPHRRFATVACDLADFKAIKNAFGGTVNDAVLAVVGGALGRFLGTRGVDTDGLTLRACVPMSVRTEDQKGGAGNRITIMVAPLPVDASDPVQRLASVREAMNGVKNSKQAIGAETLTKMEDFMPPTVLAQAARMGFSPRLYNVLVTNIPGPQFPVYLLGRQMLSMFPIAFLAPTHLLAIAIISYNGQVNLGLLGDFDGLPDLDLLAKEVEAALDELVTAAKGQTG
ncbi:MAG: diacylglycerol O-acyltransferase / wax synthase [Frankiales bacterium]|jgi:WS/DGAT/MGAT family acyltransferase|nr:diacylglycerol O-acyltransferase / wax synthase [Frankiales bacterium]